MTTDFLAPGRLWLLVIVAGLAVAYVAVLRWRHGAQVRFTQIDLLDQIAPSRPAWRRHVVAALQLAGLAVAIVAVARPVHRETERTRSEGRILLLFDVSLSMMATDVQPDRLTAAKDAARDFVGEVEPGVEIGLLSFSGVVTVDVAPTLDRDRIQTGIDSLELAESTAIGDAIAAGTRMLESGAGDGGGDESAGDGSGGSGDGNDADTDTDDGRPPGVLVVLSDGETTVGRSTSEGADAAAEAEIPVFTIAFGTPDGFIRDPSNGDVVPVPVRPADLADVAERTGGEAYEAESGGELADAYDEIAASLGETLGEEIETITELTWRWALAAFLLLSLAWGLSLWWLRGMV
jgi:Ca-activated chloride channel family protein